jgi:hypothetical protein
MEQEKCFTFVRAGRLRIYDVLENYTGRRIMVERCPVAYIILKYFLSIHIYIFIFL